MRDAMTTYHHQSWKLLLLTLLASIHHVFLGALIHAPRAPFTNDNTQRVVATKDPDGSNLSRSAKLYTDTFVSRGFVTIHPKVRLSLSGLL
ncbi:hypothetical protein TNCT_402151 [Trichonephila clavata]|uniref:Uncharacterized protein n=1 Tax=Trichonephila clavata TaxID=2740835 RepID=A0A8X6F213_TRICU|nr:hypothetical protein TNCT_402151 [Trichonephila clavata]